MRGLTGRGAEPFALAEPEATAETGEGALEDALDSPVLDGDASSTDGATDTVASAVAARAVVAGVLGGDDSTPPVSTTAPADPWVAGSWGRLCIVGTTAPFYSGHSVSYVDTCSNSDQVWNSANCSDSLRFTLAVR